MNDRVLKLVGSELSPYMHKMRMYFAYRGISYEPILSQPKIYASLIAPRTGLTKIPVVIDGDQVLTDSGFIIDHYEEKRASLNSVPLVPPTPKQALASNMMEFIAEEWLFYVGFAERFGHYEAHKEYIFAEVAYGNGSATGTHKNPEALAKSIEDRFLKARRHWGVNTDTMPQFDAFCEWYLPLLSKHFARHRYLLSDDVPCRADFALAGQLAGFFARDPTPAFLMRTKAPHLVLYIDRMSQAPRYGFEAPNRIVAVDGTAPGPLKITRAAAPHAGRPGFLSNDVVPETLIAALTPFVDLVAHVAVVQSKSIAYVQGRQDSSATAASNTTCELPRAVGYAPFAIRGRPTGATRMLQTFTLIMWDRLWGLHGAEQPSEQLLERVVTAAVAVADGGGLDKITILKRINDVYTQSKSTAKASRNQSNQVQLTVAPRVPSSNL